MNSTELFDSLNSALKKWAKKNIVVISESIAINDFKLQKDSAFPWIHCSVDLQFSIHNTSPVEIKMNQIKLND